jgi:ketosteroid isomerase-like protein
MREIQRLAEAFDLAMKNGDLDGMMVLFAQDAVIMPANRPTLVGKRAIRAFFLASFECHRYEHHHSRTEEAHATGDWAFSRGTFTYTTSPRTRGMHVRGSGKYLNVYQAGSDGSWKIWRSIWQSGNRLESAPERFGRRPSLRSISRCNSVSLDTTYS